MPAVQQSALNLRGFNERGQSFSPGVHTKIQCVGWNSVYRRLSDLQMLFVCSTWLALWNGRASAVCMHMYVCVCPRPRVLHWCWASPNRVCDNWSLVAAIYSWNGVGLCVFVWERNAERERETHTHKTSMNNESSRHAPEPSAVSHVYVLTQSEESAFVCVLVCAYKHVCMCEKTHSVL